MTNQTAAVEMGFRAEPLERRAEDDLVSRACTGDGQAFSELYERLADRIYRYIYFRVSDEETAEDLSSRVFLKAWEHLPNYKRSSSPFIAWLYTIAHNMLIDHYRTDRQPAHLDEIASLPADEASPSEVCETRLDAAALRQALELLTPIQREVITLKLIDGMDTQEVARRLRKSQGAVRALQMRGLQALAGILRKEQGFEIAD
jgi:RNA polymerase sigma-70 factor, ECF subfamily